MQEISSMQSTSYSNLRNNNRIGFVDWSKALCIFLMVVGHWKDNHLLQTYIYSFHMPALFVISGYLYKPHSCMKTIAGFSVPVVFFSLTTIVVMILLGEWSIDGIRFASYYRFGAGHCPFDGIWFLWAYLVLRCLCGDIRRIDYLKKYYIPIAIVCVMYMCFESYLIRIDTMFRGYYIGRTIPCLAFFSTGLWIKDRHPTVKTSYKYIVPLACFAFVMPLMNGKCDIYGNQFGLSYAIFAINAILSTLLIIIITSRIPTVKAIRTISKGTLVVLGTHRPILQILNTILPNTLSPIFPFITIVVCYYIILLCERYCPILLGKWKYNSFTKKSYS